jgi:hypothetical protein
VQENQCGSTGVAGFAEEQPMTLDCGVSMMNSRHDVPPEATRDPESSGGVRRESTKLIALKFWVV